MTSISMADMNPAKSASGNWPRRASGASAIHVRPATGEKFSSTLPSASSTSSIPVAHRRGMAWYSALTIMSVANLFTASARGSTSVSSDAPSALSSRGRLTRGTTGTIPSGLGIVSARYTHPPEGMAPPSTMRALDRHRVIRSAS